MRTRASLNLEQQRSTYDSRMFERLIRIHYVLDPLASPFVWIGHCDKEIQLIWHR